jgi:uncharacterized protein YqhQ
MFFWLQKILLLIAKQYTSIGGQAVIEGVMMRSPNAFVVAVRKTDGSILLRRDQWYGLSKKLNIFKKPFLRGVLVLIESMANGIVSLNYSANIAQAGEDAKKGKVTEKKKEKVDLATFFTIATSFLFGIALFVLLPHGITAWISSLKGQGFELDGFKFHFIDGIIKAFIFILYIWLIGFLPDIKRVFQYHGAEHKSIATFEAGEKLEVANARKYTTLHPRCGTSFIFFLLFISIILFSVIFALIPVGVGQPPVIKHAMAMVLKVIFTIPIAGISYEIIRFSGKHADKAVCRAISKPGMLLQRLTTKEPDDQQLEVALASIKAVLFLEEKFELKAAQEKVLKVEEVEIKTLADIEDSNTGLTDFLEA